MSAFRSLRMMPSSVGSDDILFEGWRPDVAELNNPGSLEALNVVPENGAMKPWREHTAFAGAILPEYVMGAYTTFVGSSTPRTFAGCSEGIYEIRPRLVSGDGFDIVPRWVIPRTERVDIFYPWAFAEFGRFLTATHPFHGMIWLENTDFSGDFQFTQDEGSSPRGIASARVGEFLMVATDYRIQWSAFDNIFLPWVTDPITQSDFQDMRREFGPVTGIIGGDIGYVFQQRAISRIQYVGLPGVFDIRLVEEGRGMIAPRAGVKVGDIIYYLSHDGFFAFNGRTSVPIGQDAVDSYVKRKLNWRSRLRVQCVADEERNIIIWAIPTMMDNLYTNPEQYPLTELIIYSYADRRFSHANVTVQALFTSAWPSWITGPAVASPETLLNLDAQTISFDDEFYNSQRTRPAAIDDQRRYGMFVGASSEATVDTGMYTAPENKRVFVNRMTPVVDVAENVVTGQIIGRDQLAGEWAYTDSAVPQELDGTIPVLAEGRFVRARVTIPRNVYWNNAQGVRVSRVARGVT